VRVWAFLATGIAGLAGWLLLIGLYGMYRELDDHLKDVMAERDRARKEVQEWTDALARAHRTPVVRAIAVSEASTLTVSSPGPYWEGQSIITKISGPLT